MNDAIHVDVEIVGMTHDGQGVASLDGERLFVPGALPGERARIALQRRRRRYREAELVEIVEPAPERVDPPCAYYGRCGGCALQHLSYAAQVAFKEQVVRDALERIAGIEVADWLPPLTGPEWHYRRRARLGVRYVDAKDRVLVGFKERASRFVTDMSSCLVLVEPTHRLPGLLAEAIDTTTLRRQLPQVEIAVGDDARAIVIRVLAEPTASDLSTFETLGRAHDVDVYLQRGGPGTIRLLGSGPARTLSYQLAAFDTEIAFAPTDFVQVNGVVNAAMVGSVIGRLELGRGDRVLDLYCGLGNFSLPMARMAAFV
ncbi:MAG TPA: TRAM domain-containing protein, partial [Gammaproteobacteria bacterium]|nr:TRAM domain-containing protein [Gammaproteobacteria bacterium]